MSFAKKRIYLAGPITGLSYEEAQGGWRTEFANLVEYEGCLANPHPSMEGHIELYSPMRGKNFLAGTQKIEGQSNAYAGSVMASTQSIIARDREDVRRSDLVIMGLQDAERVSIGTMVELGWADAFRVPVVVILPGPQDPRNTLPPHPHDHTFVDGLAAYRVFTVEQAWEVAYKMLTPGVA